MADLPSWSAYDDGAPPGLPAHAERPGRLVTVLTTAAARANGWAVETTLRMVEAWSQGGHRVVVADVGLDAPSLHSRFGAPNAEGVVDVVSFGASVRRVARSAPDRGFFYITAGTPSADVAAVLGSPRLKRLCEGFLDAGVTLVLFAHDECPGTQHLLIQATDAVVLSAEGDVLGNEAAIEPGSILAVTGPVDMSGDDAAEAFHTVEDGGLVLDEGLELETVADVEADEVAAEAEDVSVAGEEDPEAHIFGSLLDEGVVEEDEPALVVDDLDPYEVDPTPALAEPLDPGSFTEAEDELESPAPFEYAAPDEAIAPAVEAEALSGAPDAAPAEPEIAVREEPMAVVEPDLPGPEAEILGEAEAAPKKASSSARVLLALSLVLLGIVGAAAMGLVQIPGISPEAPPVVADDASEPAATSVPVSDATRVLAYSVAVGAYESPSEAGDRAASLASLDGVLAVVAPVSVDDVTYHRVLLGPAADSAEAVELAARVAQSTGANASDWIIRATPLAFQLGPAVDNVAAQGRLAEALGMGVPAYVLPIEYQDGSVLYRVYAGAFADEEEASYLREHLAAQGLATATLVTRLGRVTSGSE